MICPNCQNEVPESAKICGHCGTRLSKSDTRFCVQCGQEVPATAKVCGHCGARLQPLNIPAPIVEPAALSPQPSHPQKPSPEPPVAAQPQPEKLTKPAPKRPAWLLPMLAGALALTLVFIFLVLPRLSAQPEPVQQSKPQPTTAKPASAQPLPAATIKPTRAPTVDANLLLYDDFSKASSGWPTFGDKDMGEVGYAGGAYRFIFHNNKGFNAAWSPLQYANFVIEAEVIMPKGRDAGAGFTLRASEKNWYVFFIYPQSREFRFLKRVNGTDSEPRKRQFSDGIPDFEDNNRMLIKAVVSGDSIKIYAAKSGSANAPYSLVDEIIDADLKSGHAGPAAIPTKEAFSNSPIQIFFDWIKISTN